MSSDYDSDLVETAFLHMKAREFEAARQYLERALDIADDPDTRARASWLLSQITDDPAHKRSLLEEVLSYNHGDPEARRALAILDGKLRPDEIVNPDKLAPAPEGEVEPAQADRFTCPNCGARLVFSPDGESLLCEHCGYRSSLALAPDSANLGADGGGQERDFVLAMATGAGHTKPVAMHAFTCQGCGANLILRPEAISATCPYCGTPHVVDLAASRDLIEPEALVPFAFDRERAETLLAEWVGKQTGSTTGSTVRSGTRPRGIYLPVWTFDLDGDVPFQAAIEEKQGNQTVMRVIHDSFPVMYNQVAVPASRKLGSLLAIALAGYRLAEAVTYDPRYLADWPAEVYQISMADASLEARAHSVQRIKREIADYLKATYDGVANITTSPAVLSTEAFKLVLIPAWISDLHTGAQLRPILVNGQTGSIHTEEPAKSPLGWLGKLFK
jgi:predicted RNA-binding Zn-ribbon protein involved in translation (DUF1610 family)